MDACALSSPPSIFGGPSLVIEGANRLLDPSLPLPLPASMPWEYVSIGSGGTRGSLYLGALDALETHLESAAGMGYGEWREQLKGLSGCSFGSLMVLIIGLGIPKKKRAELMKRFADPRDVVRCPDLSLLMQRYGVEEGHGMREVIGSVLTAGGLSEHSTLADLKRLLRIEMVFVCTDLKAEAALYLSADTHPELKTVDAVFASCCVPFVFTPMKLGDTIVSDGVLTCNLPRVFPEDKTLFLYLTVDHPRSAPQTWQEFFAKVVSVTTRVQDVAYDTIPPENRLQLKLGESLSNLPPFDIDLTARDSKQFHTQGYWRTLNFLTSHRCEEALVDVVRFLASWSPPTPVVTDEAASDAESDPDTRE